MMLPFLEQFYESIWRGQFRPGSPMWQYGAILVPSEFESITYNDYFKVGAELFRRVKHSHEADNLEHMMKHRFYARNAETGQIANIELWDVNPIQVEVDYLDGSEPTTGKLTCDSNKELANQFVDDNWGT